MGIHDVFEIEVTGIGVVGASERRFLSSAFNYDFTGYSRELTFRDCLLEVPQADHLGSDFEGLDALARSGIKRLLNQIRRAGLDVFVNFPAECDYFLTAFSGSRKAEAKTRERHRGFVRSLLRGFSEWDNSDRKQLPDEWSNSTVLLHSSR